MMNRPTRFAPVTFAACAAAALASAADAAVVDGALVTPDRAAYAFASVAGAMTTGGAGSELVAPRGPSDVEVRYSDIVSSGLQGFPARSGSLGVEDYTSTAALAGADELTLPVGPNFVFTGGVTNAGEILFFDFFESDGTFVDGFGVAFAAGGNNIYTITLNQGLVVPAEGILQISANEDASLGPVSTGQWLFSAATPTVGENDLSFGGADGGSLTHDFELSGSFIPEPAAAGLAAIGGLVLTRRRR